MTEKEIAIRQVLEKRINIIRTMIIPKMKDMFSREYYIGKAEGLEQAYSLLVESFESIKIELDEKL